MNQRCRYCNKLIATPDRGMITHLQKSSFFFVLTCDDCATDNDILTEFAERMNEVKIWNYDSIHSFLKFAESRGFYRNGQGRFKKFEQGENDEKQ